MGLDFFFFEHDKKLSSRNIVIKDVSADQP
jgi:hypothetical protein